MAQGTPLFSKALPAELREKIWLYTFEPRTLSLRVRYHRVLPCICCRIKVFHIQLGLHDERIDGGKEPFTKRNLLPHFKYMDKDVISDAHRIKPPPGPIALETCAESRALALKYYQPIFPPDLFNPGCCEALGAAYDASGLKYAHTWVNPKLDLVFFPDVGSGKLSYNTHMDIQMLSFSREVGDVLLERVGFMSHSNDFSSLSHIQGLSGIKELVIYLTSRKVNRTPQNLEDDVEDWDEEVISNTVAGSLRHQRDRYNEISSSGVNFYRIPWTQEIPRIQISQELCWLQDGGILPILPSTIKRSPLLFRSP